MKNSRRRHFEFILFDLDETLYPKESNLMPVMKQRIVDYMVHQIGIPADDVWSVQQRLFREHGSTFQGLYREYRIDPDAFMAYVHNINPSDFFGPSPPLDRMLHLIPLEKAIFTNASRPHAERVLSALQVSHHFELIFDNKSVNYQSKPDPKAYHTVLEMLNCLGQYCIMIEDSPRNLIPAKELGMTTILLSTTDRPSLGIDYVVPTVFHVERVLEHLLSKA